MRFGKMFILRPTFWVGILVASMVVGFGLPAMAQEQQQEPSEDELIAAAMEKSFEEEITVTGTLIPRADLTALSPVTVMEVPQELTYSGIVRIEDLVVSLPQVWAGQNSTIANGATGTATINLRHLGTARTLVLINGRRLAPGDATGTWAPDINVIPSALVKRVDVLTGGASTVYGSDAVAGVVNFVMDNNFEGVRGGVQYSGYQHNNNNMVAREINQARGFDVPTGSVTDGEAWNANIAVGGKFADGKGHAVAYITHRNINAVLKGDRDYVNCAVNAGSSGPSCGGSSTLPIGRFTPFAADDSRIGDFVLHTTGDGGDGHSFRPRDSANDVYNYAPWNHLQRPDEKWNAGAFAHYTINDHFEPYIEAMFMTNFTDAQIAPSGNFNRVSVINCDNPMLSEQQWNTICGPGTGYGPTDIASMWIYRRNVEGGNRTNQIGHDNYRLVAGMRGDINDQWSYDFYYLNAQNNSFESYVNDLNVGRIRNALDVIEDPDTGEWVCRSGGDCVPWNIFTEGGVTDEALAYITTNAVMYGRTKTQVANLTLTSDWEDYGIVIPSASEGIQIAVGGEYRKQWLLNMPDEVYEFGLRAGSGGRTPAVDGEYSVAELFFEALIPIVQDARGFRDLSLELGYRYSDYKDTGNFDSYKVQASWAPNESWRIRGGYNRAVRSANIWELLRPQGFGLGGAADICAGPNPSATLEQCMRTGVTEAQYGDIFPNPADQYNTLAGGNPDLIPETADTLTAGIVWTPQSIAGLSITLDYYNIDIMDAIGTLGADDIIQTCATTGDPQLCSLIHRDRQGTLWATQEAYTETTNQNIGNLVAEGVDLNFGYMIGLGNAGYLPIDLTGTYMLQNRFSNPLTDYDCVGYYGFQCGQPDAVWRHKMRATWESKFNLNLSLNWRFLASSEIDDASSNPNIGDPNSMDKWIINGSDKTKDYHWFDLAASYTFRGGIQLTAGVNNIMDEEPPLMPGLADEMNMYASFDPLGRYFFMGLQFEF